MPESAESPSPLRIEYVVTRDGYIAAAQATTRHLLRTVRWTPAMVLLTAALVACGVVIGMGYMDLVYGYIGVNRRWQWWIVLALLCAWLFSIWQQRLRARQIYAATTAHDMLGAQSLTITPEALIHQGNGLTSHVAWPALRHVEEISYNILIILNNFQFFYVPHEAFSSAEARRAWVTALRERMRVPAKPVAGDSWSAAPRPAQSDVISAPDMEALPAVGLRGILRAGARLVFFRRVHPDEFAGSAEAFIVLVVLHLVLSLALGFAYWGVKGEFNFYELPRALLGVPLMLCFGLLVARAARVRAMLLTVSIALWSAGMVFSMAVGMLGLLFQHRVIVIPTAYWPWVFYAEVAWWSAIIVFALRRLAPVPRHSLMGLAAAGFVLLVAPWFWYPQNYLWVQSYDREAQDAARPNMMALAEEQGFYAQQQVLQRALSALRPERPGIADLYTLTAGLYAGEDVFMKETRRIDALLRSRFDAEGRSLLLINNPQTVRDYPIASLTSISAALNRIGGLMNRDEDVLVLYVSSHGSAQHRLSVDFWPLRLQTIDPVELKQALDASGIKWRVIVVSACYSGGFVEPLKNDSTLIITASSATRTSFGCGSESDATYLAQALFDEELRRTYSFETAFNDAKKSIMRREKARGYEPSEPQMFVGAAIRDKLSQVEQRLAARRP